MPTYPIPGSISTTDGQYNDTSISSNTGARNLIGPAPGSLTGPTPGSLSNVTGWVPDIMEIGQEACEQAGVDYTTGYTLRSLKRSLDYLMMAWSNYGLNLYSLEELQTVLTPGVANYLMPADTIDMVSAAIRTQIGVLPDNSPRWEDILVSRMDFDTYFSFPQKQTPGKPTSIFVQRSIPNPQFFVWPVPNTYQTYTLLWWRLKRTQNTGNSTNIMGVPFEFIPALTTGLAWQMAIKKKGQPDYNRIQMLKADYNESFTKALGENHDRSSVYLSPMIGWS